MADSRRRQPGKGESQRLDPQQVPMSPSPTDTDWPGGVRRGHGTPPDASAVLEYEDLVGDARDRAQRASDISAARAARALKAMKKRV
ncbi:MAG: hypothetical protein AB1609_16645 [Bacillota bacterium]